jgi:hypothetical protein
MDLDEPSIEFKPVHDRRPVMPQPPPVRLVAVDDVHLPAAAGLEKRLDDFYVSLLQFEREGADTGHLHYKAERFHLIFDVLEPPIDRENMRAILIDVPSLRAAEQGLIDREIEYERCKSLTVGEQNLLLQDPAGNWVQIGEFNAVGL